MVLAIKINFDFLGAKPPTAPSTTTTPSSQALSTPVLAAIIGSSVLTVLTIIAIMIITTVFVYSEKIRRGRHDGNIYDVPALDSEVPIPQPPPVNSIPPRMEMKENVAYLQVKDIDLNNNSAYTSISST